MNILNSNKLILIGNNKKNISNLFFEQPHMDLAVVTE